jgi:hypothetical protein
LIKAAKAHERLAEGHVPEKSCCGSASRDWQPRANSSSHFRYFAVARFPSPATPFIMLGGREKIKMLGGREKIKN